CWLLRAPALIIVALVPRVFRCRLDRLPGWDTPMSLARARLLALLSCTLMATDGLQARQEPDPEPPSAGLGELGKYFPDDAHCAGIINVKRLAASALVKKHLRKPAEKLLDNPNAAPILKKLGVDPFRDVEYVAVVLGDRSFNARGGNPE